jgi:hypothetical protein
MAITMKKGSAPAITEPTIHPTQTTNRAHERKRPKPRLLAVTVGRYAAV